MNFNVAVNQKIAPVLSPLGFKITMHFENYTRFESDSMFVALATNKFDGTNLLEIGRRDEFAYPIYDKLLNKVYGFTLKIEQVLVNVFLTNVEIFFLDKGAGLISGDQTELNLVISFFAVDIKNYRDQMNNESYFQDADKAWINKNYREFVKIVDQIDKKYLPKSYILKYQLAARNS